MFLHQASGLYLTENRAYDPYTGRWLSRDPAGEPGGLNLYGYVNDGPINGVDPSGLFDPANFIIPAAIDLLGGPAASRGVQAHNDFRQWVQQQPGWQANPQLTGEDGNTYIPDAIDPEGNIVELKPNTPSGRAKGASQIRKYFNQTGIPGRVIYYNP